MDDFEAHRRGTEREWLAARIVIGGGFVIAIAVAAFFALRPAPQAVPVEQQASAPTQQEQTAAPQSQSQSDAKAAMMVCAMELVNAKNIGIIPPDGQLTSLMPKDTGVQGRYSCSAATSAAKYKIAADLVCRNVQNARCIFLYNIETADGTVLYQRQQQN
jgi:hypothetical protein